MKDCPKCKRGYGDEMYYCLTDGSYLSPVRDPEKTIAIEPPQRPQTTIAATPEALAQPPDSSGALSTKPAEKIQVGTWIVVGSAILIAGLVLVGKLVGEYEARQTNYPTAPPPPYSMPVTKESFVVEAHSETYWNFKAFELGMLDISFEASGGDNRITVAVLNEDDYRSYRNTGQSGVNYYSGYMVTDSRKVWLYVGTYYVIFKNPSGANKTIRAKVTFNH